MVTAREFSGPGSMTTFTGGGRGAGILALGFGFFLNIFGKIRLINELLFSGTGFELGDWAMAERVKVSVRISNAVFFILSV